MQATADITAIRLNARKVHYCPDTDNMPARTMEDIYGRAAALIGKTPDDKEFRQFVEDIGEVPVVGPRVRRVYVFAKFAMRCGKLL